MLAGYGGSSQHVLAARSMIPDVACPLPAVYINDKELSPRKKKQKHAWRFEDGSAVEMSWDPYTPGIGNAIVVATGRPWALLCVPACLHVLKYTCSHYESYIACNSTCLHPVSCYALARLLVRRISHAAALEHPLWLADVLKVMVWHTPKGIIDEGGQVLEGYVNFNITLMAPPEDDRMAVSSCTAALLAWVLSAAAASHHLRVLCCGCASGAYVQQAVLCVCEGKAGILKMLCFAGYHWRDL